MSDYFVVRDDTSSSGLRRLHLLKAGGRFERDEVLEKWGIFADLVRAVVEYLDEDVGIWHLRIYWKEIL